MCNAPAFHQAPRPFTDDFHARWGSIPRLMRFSSRVLGFFYAIQISLRRWRLMWMSRDSNIPLRSSSLKYVLHPRNTALSFAIVLSRDVPLARKKITFSLSRSLWKLLGCTRGAPVVPTKVYPRNFAFEGRNTPLLSRLTRNLSVPSINEIMFSSVRSAAFLDFGVGREIWT